MPEEMPAWVAACPTCREHIRQLAAARADLRQDLELMWAARRHLVDVHLAQLPDYDETCGTCWEWQHRDLERHPGPIMVDLGTEDLMHRAEHVLRPILRQQIYPDQ